MATGTSRWITVEPPNSGDPEISMVAADDPMYQEDTEFPVEARTGFNTLWIFTTGDLDAAVMNFEENDVDMSGIQETPWGRMVTVQDADNAF